MNHSGVISADKRIEAHKQIPQILLAEILHVLALAQDMGIACDESIVRTDGKEGLLVSFTPSKECTRANLQLYWAPMARGDERETCIISLRCGDRNALNPNYVAQIRITSILDRVHSRSVSVEGADHALQQYLGFTPNEESADSVYYRPHINRTFSSPQEYEDTLCRIFRIYLEQPTPFLRST